MGMSRGSVVDLVADALDLRHRLPNLWQRMVAGFVKPWVARKVAVRTRMLSFEAAALVDESIAPLVDTVPLGRLLRLVDAEILKADPAQAKTGADTMAAQQGVWVSRDSHHGYATLVGKAP